MEEKLLEELQSSQHESVKRDVSSPLFMIREKEMEISGRVLAAKQEAERIVAEARRKAAETVNRAEAASEDEAAKHQESLLKAADEEVVRLRDGFADEVAPIEERIRQHRADAVSAVVDVVTRV